MNIYAPITKAEPMEDGRLRVIGVATSESLDKDDEIMDYGAAVKAFAAWPGNIREQHDSKKAVGRAIAIMPDDANKSIQLEAFVSAGAKDTQAKVLDGTLAGFSIGGQSERKVPEVVKVGDEEKQATRIFLKRLSEVSLVDSPCNPACSFQLVKADGDSLNAVGLDGGDWEPGEMGEDGLPVNVDKAGKDSAKKPYGDVKYADPGYQSDGKKRYPLDSEAHVRAAWSYINMPKNAKKYSSSQLSNIKGRIRAAMKKYGIKSQEKTMSEPEPKVAAPTEGAGDAVVKYDGGEILDVQTAIQALSMIRQLISVESSESHNEPPDQVPDLQAACDHLVSFIQSEIGESEDDEPDDAQAADEPADVAKDDVAMAAGACPKCGGVMKCFKCDKADAGHEGGNPEPAPAAEPPAAKADPPPHEVKADVSQPATEAGFFDVQKAIGDLTAKLDTAKAEFDSYRTESEAEKASLKAELAKIGQRVVEPGRPVYKGADGKPTDIDPMSSQKGVLGISVEDILKLAPDADRREVAIKLAEMQTAAVLNRSR